MTPKQEAFARAYVETGNASEAAERAGVFFSIVPPVDGRSYVYFILCPDMQHLIYIGKGRGNRMNHHVRDARRGKVSGTKKHNAIVEFLQRGETPVSVVFESGLNDREAYRLEKALIASIGHNRLANTAASRGCPHEKAIAQAHGVFARLVKVPPPGKEKMHGQIVEMLNHAIAMANRQIAIEQRC